MFLPMTRHVASIVTLLMVLACASLQANEKEHQSGNDQDPATEPNASPGTAINQPAPETNKPAAGQDAPQWYRWWLLSATPTDWILAIVGSGTLIAAYFTLRAMRDQVSANVKAADAARNSAEATLAQVQLVRPYLELTKGRVVELPSDSVELQVEFDVHNFGQTAARLDVVERQIEQLDAINSTHPMPDSPRVMIPPGHAYQYGFYIGKLSDPQRDLYATRDQRVLAYRITGRMIYTDQFGKAHPKTFGWIAQCRSDGRSLVHPLDLPGFNEEEDWGKSDEEKKGEPK